MNDRQMKALAHAEGNGGIDARTFRRLCPHWSVETLRLDLSRLVAMGLLVKVGRKKGTRYVVGQKEDRTAARQSGQARA
jgi:predicted HTH transcriptional regulator